MWFVKRTVIEFLTPEKCLPSSLTAVCRRCAGVRKCVDGGKVRRWIWQLKQEVGEATVCDKATSVRRVTVTDVSHEERAEEMIGIEPRGDYVER
jgi:hypothetical protein